MLGALDLAIIAIYLAALLAIGVWISRKVRSFQSFFVAGRLMTTPLLISTLVSTYYGLDVTFGVSELSFSEGIVAWFVYSRPYYLAILIAGLLLVRRLKAYPFLSLPDVVEHIYGKGARVTVALASLVYNLPILAIMGMGVLIRVTLGLPEIDGYLIGAILAALYTLLGGIWADAITDTFQFVIMCVTLAIALPIALDLVDGFSWLFNNMEAKYFIFTGDLPAAYLIALGLTALSVLVEPAFYQRIFAAADERSVRRALLTGILLWAAYDWAVTLLGMAGAAAVKQQILPADLQGREALLRVALIAVPVGLKGLFIAGLLSAAMSTIDSYLLLASGNLVYDIYRPLFRPSLSDASLLRLTRLGILVALAPCLLIALYFQRITDAWLFMANMLTATAFIPIMAGLFLARQKKPLQGLLSSLAGFLALLVYYGLVSNLGLAQKDSYVWTVSFFSRRWDLWREYGLFVALPASAAGYICGSFSREFS